MEFPCLTWSREAELEPKLRYGSGSCQKVRAALAPQLWFWFTLSMIITGKWGKYKMTARLAPSRLSAFSPTIFRVWTQYAYEKLRSIKNKASPFKLRRIFWYLGSVRPGEMKWVHSSNISAGGGGITLTAGACCLCYRATCSGGGCSLMRSWVKEGAGGWVQSAAVSHAVPLSLSYRFESRKVWKNARHRKNAFCCKENILSVDGPRFWPRTEATQPY